MHTACERAVSVLGEMLALLTRDQRGVGSSHDTNTAILAIADR
jgi:hypothetical protein